MRGVLMALGPRPVTAAIVAGSMSLVMMSARPRSQEPLPEWGELPAFEVASVRPSDASGWRWSSRFEAARYVAVNAPLKEIVKVAFDLVINDQIRGGPEWMGMERFDIRANAESRTTPDRLRLMLQSLLIERFGLVTSKSNDRRPVYVLMYHTGRPQPGLTLLTDEECCGLMRSGSQSLTANAMSMSRFAELLSGSSTFTGIDRLVIDRTGLSGVYDVSIRYSPPQVYGLRRPESKDLPQFFTALREQTGLALEAREEDVEVLVVDRIRRPEPN